MQLNFFDMITIACKFLNQNDLKKFVRNTVTQGIEEGNLGIIPLIGLKSKNLFKLLQRYVD